MNIDQLTKDLTDNGKIIEGGWLAMRACAIHGSAPENQIIEMRKAFFAGAQHLFSSIMSTLDTSQEPTDDDFRRLGSIATELDSFVQEMKLELVTEGNA